MRKKTNSFALALRTRVRAAMVLIAMLCVASGAWADQITTEEALQQAQDFFSNRTVSKERTSNTTPQLVAAGEISGLYVFNTTDKSGFVIVSNDDGTHPILGFSESGSLDPVNIPANMRAWLQGYADEIAWLQKQGPKSSQSSQRKASRRTGTHSQKAIAPLLSCLWNQGTPFNNLCPMYSSTEKAVTGCVATAMAQVMYYHKWPQAATTAIPGYITRNYGINLSAGLPSTTFDWANMLDNYNNSYNDTEATAVAKLMQYCGYSVQMDYGPSSGAYTQDVAIALKTYFGYNGTTKYVSRTSYTYDNWIDLIYFELSHKRPVVYGGNSTGGGHEFVCDGYKYEDNTDFFHINWGWGGTSDNYFVLSALDPYEQGIGGSTSTDGFSHFQDAVIGIQKSTDTGVVADISPNNNNLSLNSMTLSSNPVGTNTTVTITANVRNNNTVAYEGEISLGRKTDQNGIFIIYMDEITIPAGESKDWVIPYTPTDEGTYDFVLCYINSEGGYATDGVVGASLQVVATNGIVPIYGYWVDNYSRSQFIIPAEQLNEMTDGTLNGVTFYASNSLVNWGAAEFDVYLGEVNETTFTNTTLKDWTSLDKVYSGSLSISDGRMEIVFDNSYLYQGGNLLVGIKQTESGSYSSCTWLGTTATGASLGGYETNIYQQNFIPQTTFDFTAADPNAVQKPRKLVVAYTGGTTATVSWTCDEAAFDIDVNGTVTENVTNPYMLTNLELGTTYAVRVRAKNGNNYSNWTYPVSFTTDLCMPENQCVITFELTDSYGDGWNEAAIKVVDVLTGDVLGQFANQNLDEETQVEETNTYTLAVCTGREIRFQWVSGGYDSECFYVVKDINDDVIFEGSGAMSESVTYTVDCTQSIFRRPTNLAAYEIGPRSVKLSWTENSLCTVNAWVVAYKATGDDYFNEVVADANPYTLNGLTYETEYTVKVRPATDEVEKWSDEITFTTIIAAPAPTDLSIAPYPEKVEVSWNGFAENYEVQYVQLPAEGFGEGWLQYDDNQNYTNIGNTTAGNRTWGVMYPGSMATGNKLTKISFYENATYYTIGTTVQVNIYSGGDNAPCTLVHTEDVTASGVTGFHEVTFESPIAIMPGKNLWITLTVNGTYVMAACQMNNYNNQWWNTNGSWSNMGEDNASLAGFGWMIRGYFESDASDINWTTTNTTEESYDIAGLTPETTYLVQVRGDFGSDGLSEWVTSAFTTLSVNATPINLTADVTATSAILNWADYQDSYNVQYRTAAKITETFFFDDFEAGLDQWTLSAGNEATHPSGGIWYTINPSNPNGLSFEAHSGTYCASSWSWNNSAYNADNWLITPQVTFGGTLKFWVRTNKKYPDHYSVLLSTGGNTTEDFTVALQVMATAPNNGQWNEVTIDLSAYAGQQGYIAIHHQDYDKNYLLIDDFGIYNLSYPGEWISASVDEASLTITGLTPDTEYEWQVQGNLTEGTTEWSELATFTTHEGTDIFFAKEGYATYYDGLYAVELPAGMKAYIVSGGNGNNTLNYVPIADGDLTEAETNIVPAGTAVMLQVAAAEKDQYIPVRLVNSTGIDPITDTNMLFGSDTEVNTSGPDNGTNYFFYKLCYSTDGDEFGWYWGKEGGGAFSSPAHKAWLALATNNAYILSLPGHEGITGIKSVGKDTTVAKSWYTINGMKLDKQPTSKGLYIHNGKKVVVE